MNQFTKEELALLEKLIVEKIEGITKEIKLLDNSGDSFYINDGLINEVRISREAYKKKLNKFRELLNKILLSKDMF